MSNDLSPSLDLSSDSRINKLILLELTQEANRISFQKNETLFGIILRLNFLCRFPQLRFQVFQFLSKLGMLDDIDLLFAIR